MNNYRNGHPEQQAVKINNYDSDMVTARQMLAPFREHPATAAAISLAQGLMNYKATTPISYDVRLEGALRRLRDEQIAPAELVMRFVAFQLFATRKPFRSQKAEDVALGRLLLHAAPAPGFSYGAPVYGACGQIARQHLALFASKLIQRVTTDAEATRALIAKSADL